MKKMNEFKKGAASFYIVAIATLLLVIVATSFIAVIISEVTRTSNNDLAQSAYDSALAGIEDAKLAYYNYQECLRGSEEANCGGIKNLIENESQHRCDMVASIIGRAIVKRATDDETGEVVIEETTDGSNNMQQAYTCVILKTKLTDYRVTLGGGNPTAKVVKLGAIDNGAKNIRSIRISWGPSVGDDGSVVTGSSDGEYADFGADGIFDSQDLVPPVLAVGLVQTSGSFSMEDFDMTKGDQTDRGTLYLVPANGQVASVEGKFEMAKAGNKIDKDGFLKSNDKTTKNVPYVVDCNGDGNEYKCSVEIELPEPVDGERSDSTFRIIPSLPDSEAKTDVKIEYLGEGGASLVQEGVQIEVDSTGRANDLYRRVVTRLNVQDDSGQFPMYAIQLLGTDSEYNSLIKKDIWTQCEWDFAESPTCSE